MLKLFLIGALQSICLSPPKKYCMPYICTGSAECTPISADMPGLFIKIIQYNLVKNN